MLNALFTHFCTVECARVNQNVIDIHYHYVRTYNLSQRSRDLVDVISLTLCFALNVARSFVLIKFYQR